MSQTLDFTGFVTYFVFYLSLKNSDLILAEEQISGMKSQLRLCPIRYYILDQGTDAVSLMTALTNLDHYIYFGTYLCISTSDYGGSDMMRPIDSRDDVKKYSSIDPAYNANINEFYYTCVRTATSFGFYRYTRVINSINWSESTEISSTIQTWIILAQCLKYN